MTRFARAAAIVLIIAGLACAGYPIYLRIQANIEQQRLEQEFAEYMINPSLDSASQEIPLPPDLLPSQAPTQPDLPQWTELPPTRLAIPAIDLEVQVVTVKDMDIFARKLSQPPSYYPQSSMPGQVGNVLIAGRRRGNSYGPRRQLYLRG